MVLIICFVDCLLILCWIIFIKLVIDKLKCDNVKWLGLIISCVLLFICFIVIFLVLGICWISCLICWFFLFKIVKLFLNNLMVNWVFIFDKSLFIWVVMGCEKLNKSLGNCFSLVFISCCNLICEFVLIYWLCGFKFK